MTTLENIIVELTTAPKPREVRNVTVQPAGTGSRMGKALVTVAMVISTFVLVLTLSLSDAWAYGDFEWLEDHEEGVYHLSDSRTVLFVGFDYGDDGTDLSIRWRDPQGDSTTACPEWDSCTTSTYVYSGGVIVGKKAYFYIEEQDRVVGTYQVEVHEWGYADPIFADTFEIKGPTVYLPLVQASYVPMSSRMAGPNDSARCTIGCP